MMNKAMTMEKDNRTSHTDNMLNQSSNIGRGGRVMSDDNTHSRLDIDFVKNVAQKSRMTKKKQLRIEIEAQGEIVKDFMCGNTRIKINDAYCRDKTPNEVAAILSGITIRTQEQLTAQEIAKSAK